MKMRKILSFVLVLALVLGSFSMAFATTPTDVVGTPNEAAVQVLMGLGVVNGYEDGSFKPEGIVTRAEMAKLIVVALGLQDYAVGTSKYPDMGGATWAQGYVTYATGLGVIEGYPDGTFKPSATVSYAEACTMIVRALGYTDASLLPATWPANYVVKAKALGILDDVTTSAAGATRGNIAEMLYNALTAGMVSVDSENKVSVTIPADNMMLRLGAKLNVANASGAAFVIDGTQDTLINIAKYIGVYADVYTIDGDVVAVDPISTNLNGKYVDSNGTYSAITTSGIFEASDDDYSVSATVADKEVPKFVNGVKQGTLKTLDTISKATTYDLAVDVSGKTIKEVYSMSTWFIEAAELFTADDADTIKDDQTLMGEDFILDDNDAIDMNQFVLQGVASLEDIAVDDVVYVSANNGIRRIQVGTEVITGKVTEKDGADYTIGGKVYNLSDESATKSLTVGDTITARLDYSGDIFDVDVDSTTVDMYGIIKAYAPAGINDEQVKLYTSADATKTFNINDDKTTTGTGITIGSIYGLVGYGLDSDGNIEALNFKVKTGTAAQLTSAKVLSITAGASVGTYAVASDVVVFTVDGTTYDVTTIDKIKTLTPLTTGTLQMIQDADGYVVAIVVASSAAGKSDSDTYAVINKVVTAIDANDDPIQKLTGFANGAAFTKYTDDAGDITVDLTKLQLFKLDLDVDGIVTTTSQMAVDTAVTGGSVIATDGLNSDKSAVKVLANWYALADNAVVYQAELVDGDYEYSLSSNASLRAGYHIALFETDIDSDGYDVVIFEK